MFVPTNIRIKIISWMAKFESSTTVQQKLEAEFGQNALKEDCIIATFLWNWYGQKSAALRKILQNYRG